MKLPFAITMFVFTLILTGKVAAQPDAFSEAHQIELSLSDLPSLVKETLDAEQYKGWKIIGVFQSDQHPLRGPKARYLIRLKLNLEIKDVYIDGAGVIHHPN